MIANFPMYARPETEAIIAEFWAAIRTRLAEVDIDSPEQLFQDQEDLFAVWLAPDLVLGHTCGFPYSNFLYEKVTMIGTLDFGLEGCKPGYYRSAFVVRKNDIRKTLADFHTAVFAYNEDVSQSGFNAPLCHVASKGGVFENQVKSGGHVASAAMIARGDADIAAIDGVTWRLIQKYDAIAKDLRLLDWTSPATPGLPLISAKGADAESMYGAIEKAIDDLAAELYDEFGLRGMVKIPAAEYLAVPNLSGMCIQGN